MLSQPATPRSLSRSHPWLSALALASALLLIGPVYLWRALVYGMRFAGLEPPVVGWYLTTYGYLYYYPNLFLSDLGRYLGASALAVLLGVAALVLHRPRPLTAALLVVGLAGVLTFPLLYRYEPALVPAPGRQMLVATETGPIEGVVKRAQQHADLAPCEYALLGWGDGDLYYRSTCDVETRAWVLDPAGDARPQPIASVPAGLIVEESQSAAVAAVRYRTASAEYEGNLRIAAIQGKVGLVSPDGRWVAIVSRHVYGPRDVLVVSQ